MSEMTREKRTTKIGDLGLTVESETGYTIILRAMWSGREQAIRVDPADVPALIEELRHAARLADGHEVDRV